MRRDRGASAEGTESIRSGAGLGIPKIIAGEIDVLPADGSKVGQPRVQNNFAAAALLIQCTTEIYSARSALRAWAVNLGSPDDL
jgi:hypothetical protein